MPMWVRNAGAWRAVETGGLYVRNSGSWKQVEQGWVRNSGSWREFYIRSDPLTLTFAPDWTQTYMFNGENAVGSILSGVSNNDVIQGYWDTSQSSPAGTWSHVTGAMSFNDIAVHKATRPFIKSAVLRMGLKVGYGGTPLDSRLDLGAFTAATSTPSTLAHTDTAKDLQETTATIWTGEGQVKEVAFNAAMLDQLQSQSRYGIALHDTTHGTSETRKRQTRTIWYGASAASNLAPRLTVTFDYV